MVGDVIGMRYVETLPHGAWGQYADGLITPAVGEGTRDPASTLNHEIIHVLRECGVIDDEEWGERVARAERLDHPALDIRGRWPGRNEGELVGEAICEACRSWCADELPMPTGIRAVFGRIRRFARDLRRWAGLARIRSWEDIFESIRGGERRITDANLQTARAAMSRDIQDNVPRNDEGMDPSADGRARGTNVTDKWRQRPWLADKPPVPVVDGGLPEGFPGDPHTQAVWRKWQSERLNWAMGVFFQTVRRKNGQPLLQGNVVRNADSGMDIRITKDGIQHTLLGGEGTSPDGREAIVANLSELLGAAVLYQTVPAGKNRKVDCYHSFLVPMADGVEVSAVRLVVRQADGNITFYTAGILEEISNTPTLPPQGARTISGRTVPVAQLVEGVRYYDETKDVAGGPMILGSSWSGLGARLRRRRRAEAERPQPEAQRGRIRPLRTGHDFGERLLADWDRHCAAAAEAGRHPHRFAGKNTIFGQMEVLLLRGGLPEAQRRAMEDVMAERRRMREASATVGHFMRVSEVSGRSRERILEEAAADGRSPRQHPGYAEWIGNTQTIEKMGRGLLADERAGVVMAGGEGYRERVEARVGRMEAYLREHAVRVEADAVRERWDAFRTAAEAEGVGAAHKAGFGELSLLAGETAGRADLPADMREPAAAVRTAMFEAQRTAALQWRNPIVREADTDGRSRLGHDAYRDWHRYCLDLEAEGTAILDHARAAGLPDRDGALARIREAVGTAAAWRGEDEAQDRYIRTRRNWEWTWRDVAADGGHILSLPKDEYQRIILPVLELAKRTDLPAQAREWADDVRREIGTYNRAERAVTDWSNRAVAAYARSNIMRREAVEAGIPVREHPDWAQWERGIEGLASELGGLRDVRATAAGLARDGRDARADERIAELRGRRGEDLAEQQ